VKSKASRGPILAVDLGGTNLRLGLVAQTGQVVRRSRGRMRDVTGKDVLCGDLAEKIRSFIGRAGKGWAPAAVAVGFAGPTDSASGRVYCAPNVGGLGDLYLAEGLSSRLGLPVVVANDADCAALGEYWRGAGMGTSSFFLFTLGTGMGGAMVIDGDLWEGCAGIAGEIGHTVIDIDGPKCACGRRGCLEAFVSATAIVREYRRRGPQGSEGAAVTAKDVFQLARGGDPIAGTVVAGAARALGIGMANVFHLLNPEVILIGGGVARAGRALIGPAAEHARAEVFPVLRDRLKVARARLGDDAGLIGAAYLAYRRLFAVDPAPRLC
jgi:glucokinase